MAPSHGVIDKNTKWYVKALSSGEAWPRHSGLAPLFRKAGVTTLPDALRYGATTFGNKHCMATRKLIARHQEMQDGKLMEKLTLGDYYWLSYNDAQERASSVGTWLQKHGFKFGDRTSIFAETRAEWFIAAMGCLQQRVSVCTIYTTLNDEAIVHALNETEVPLVFSSLDLISRLSKLIPQCPHVTSIVMMEDQLEGIGELPSFPKYVTVTPFSEITSLKNKQIGVKIIPEPSDVAIIMYTSGSTGAPKGVELTHANIMSSVIAFSCQMDVGSNDRYLSFLPLAHILELATEIALISLGITIYYSSPYTITTSSSKIAVGTIGDSRLAKPTYMNSVPLMLDRILKGVSEAVGKQGWLKKTIFYAVVSNKTWLDRIPYIGKFVDRVVFQKVRDELGGALKRMVVGGAPLSPQTHNDFRNIFGCTLQVGYGTTETASCAAGMNDFDVTTGHCGGPCLNVFVRLADWDEGNYRITDKPYPRGEILLGGPCVANGYFKLPSETANSFFEEDGERWFKTGDIGEIDDVGRIRIIDRKKDLIKLKHGEYISLGNAESKLKTLNVVDNICIFADSTRDKTVAVVVPVLEVLRKIAVINGIKDPEMTLEQLCEEDSVSAAVLKELQLHGRRCGLSRYEIPAAVHLANELWTPDTGLVTAALKLRRKQLGQQYQSMVLEMYSRLKE